MPQPSGVLRCDWAKMLAETLFFDASAAGLAALKDWGVEVEADRQRISRTAACINLLQAYDGEAQSLDRCQTLGFLTKLDGWLTAEEAASFKGRIASITKFYYGYSQKRLPVQPLCVIIFLMRTDVSPKQTEWILYTKENLLNLATKRYSFP